MSISLLTKKQLAEELKIGLRSLDSLMAKRAIPFLKLGKSVRFDPEAVKESLKGYTVRAVTLPARSVNTTDET